MRVSCVVINGRQYTKYMKSLVAIIDQNQICKACKFHSRGFPYREYKEYNEEHAVPINASLYALLEWPLGTSGKTASTATMNTMIDKLRGEVPIPRAIAIHNLVRRVDR